ncbi:MFS transporter [Cupriavidus sp. AU9028]|uniref:MFS transporter n=1 Tax=Cupriavidus sp. AU9028 TaxID=2871157 RepID=UPI001C983322|nr:MFS transporter [Cupriavidus sp. AU9028]MBY4895932.1 MFS transporter [Cupriavidus sp. AU9028]
MGATSDEYQFKPHERPMMPGSPATPDHPVPRRIAYFCVGSLLGLTGGFGNALVVANLSHIQGVFGLYSDEVAWLSTVYVMTNVTMSLLLIKFRQQFGLQRFTAIFLLGYVALALAHIFVHTFETALLVRAANGITASGLSTLALFYMIQSMPPVHRLKGIVLGIGVPQLATPLARTLTSGMLEAGNWTSLYLFELGLALLSLAAVALLRLPPSERIRAFEPLDFVTFALFAPGIALLCAVLGQGRIVWWTEVPWLGYALCGAVVLITAALWIEHNRANPLLNTRWLGSRDIVRFAVVAVSVRILLSEQNFGAVGLLTALGLNNDQLVSLFAVVTAATIAGIAVSALTLNPANIERPIRISLVLIAIGAFMDARSTNLTRPATMVLSQALIAFAAVYFMGPALLSGMLRALSRGMSHIVSFSALFSITQSLGGLGGTALLGTFQVYREKFHSHALAQSISLSDPLDAARIQALGNAYGRVVQDPALRQFEGVALLSQQVTREANVLAFNDVFLVVGTVAALTFVCLFAIYVRDRIRGHDPMAETLAELARRRAQAQQGTPPAPASSNQEKQ